MTGFILYVAILLIIGLIALFWGKKFLSFLVAAGFFVIATKICAEIPQVANYSIIISIIVAIVGYFLANATEKVAFFLIGLGAGYFLGNCVIALVDSTLPVQTATIIEIVIGVIFGILCSIKSSLFVELFTAIFGARVIADAAVFLVFDLQTATLQGGNLLENISHTGLTISSAATAHSSIVLIITIVLGALGFLYQHKHH